MDRLLLFSRTRFFIKSYEVVKRLCTSFHRNPSPWKKIKRVSTVDRPDYRWNHHCPNYFTNTRSMKTIVEGTRTETL